MLLLTICFIFVVNAWVIEWGYHVQISFELNNQLEDLYIDEFKWINPYILKEEGKCSKNYHDENFDD